MDGSAELLTAVVFLPSLGALLLTLFPVRDHTNLKATVLGVSILTFSLSLGLWFGFEPTDGYAFVTDVPWVAPLGIGYRVGIDGISLLLVVLTTFLMPITVLAAWNSIDKRVKEFAVSMLVLETGMLGAFVALDLFLFYVFWEAMLIPMYFIIGVWGGARRVYAAVKFFLFTMAASLLMLLAIIYVASTSDGWDFSLQGALQRSVDPAIEPLLFWSFALAFAVKVPMFPVHTWLPDAHTEAPTPGSMILAGVLLKLGVYGFVRFAFPLFPDAAVGALPVLGWLAVTGVLYGALVAWVQSDMKKLVAYSSVSHLGFCMLGLSALTAEGVAGALFVCIAHGLSTGALFMLVGVLYERRHTRVMADYGGIARQMPVFAFFLVMTAMASAGLPALSGFPGEFLVLLGTFTAPVSSSGMMPRLWGILAAIGVILAAVYLLWMVQRILFGPLTNPANRELSDMNPREIFVASTLMGAALVLGLAPSLVLDPLAGPSEAWIGRIQRRAGVEARVDVGSLRPQLGQKLRKPPAHQAGQGGDHGGGKAH